jgi:drug/metabolite transporter (DMT)-like permease
MNSNWKAHLALILTNFFYGINYIIVKSVMPDYVSPVALTFLRIVPSSVLFILAGLMVKEKITDKRDFKYLFLAGFLGVFLSQFLFIKGLNYSSPIDASILVTTTPILVMIVSVFAVKEKISTIKIIGILTGASGALLLVGGKGLIEFNRQNLFGDMLLLFNSVAFAIYLAVARPLMIKYNTIVVMKWVFVFGAILYIPFGIHGFIDIQWSKMPLKVVAGISYIILIATFLNYFLMNAALKKLRSTVVSIYLYTQPVIASITAIVFGVDKPTLINMSACSLVFVGVYLVSKQKQ